MEVLLAHWIWILPIGVLVGLLLLWRLVNPLRVFITGVHESWILNHQATFETKKNLDIHISECRHEKKEMNEKINKLLFTVENIKETLDKMPK